MGADELGTHAQLRAHRSELCDPAIERHRGHIANTAGDSILAEFASVVDAVTCAVEIQRGIVGRNAEVSPDKRLEFRIGINVGDVIADGGDIFGDGSCRCPARKHRRSRRHLHFPPSVGSG